MREVVTERVVVASGRYGPIYEEVPVERPPEIVKEGLSEYFIYTIGGRHDLPDRWSQRMLSFQARGVEFDTVYRVRPHQYGDRPVKFLTVKNDEEHGLGTTPLPDGLVRTFQDNGRGGLSFLGEQQVKYVPIKEDIELNLGTDDEVVWERTAMSCERSNFTFAVVNAPPRLVGWDQTLTWREQIRNYRAKPIRAEVRHVMDGDVELEAEGARLHDYRTVEFTFDVPAREEFAWQYESVEHMNSNKSQDRISLK
jgi:hypothetical protein